jgi:hypothetical protein
MLNWTLIYFVILLTSYTSKHLAKEAINFAPKSIPTVQANPATNAANTAAYLQKKKMSVTTSTAT